MALSRFCELVKLMAMLLVVALLVLVCTTTNGVSAADDQLDHRNHDDVYELSSPHATDLADVYARSATGLSDGTYKLYWTLTDTHLQLAIDAKTIGWVGFGIAQPGISTMALADIVTAHVNDLDGFVEVVDRFSTGETTPEPDCKQDWEVVSGRQVGI